MGNEDAVTARCAQVDATESAEKSASRLAPVQNTMVAAELAFAGPSGITGAHGVIKRVLDVTIAALALVLLAPLLLVVAVLVRLTSGGPALFQQVRLGKDGREFRVLKFRTMVADAEAQRDELLALNEGGNLLYFKIRNDPRITPLGKWLRKLSIDELPQLINVLRGDMSLVGPRPLHGRLDGHAADFGRRLLVQPGITGLWQVSGRSTVSADDALRMDLHYVENWSLRMDVAILARTVGAVLRSDGAY